MILKKKSLELLSNFKPGAVFKFENITYKVTSNIKYNKIAKEFYVDVYQLKKNLKTICILICKNGEPNKVLNKIKFYE